MIIKVFRLSADHEFALKDWHPLYAVPAQLGNGDVMLVCEKNVAIDPATGI